MALKEFQQGLLFGFDAQKNVFDLLGGNILVRSCDSLYTLYIAAFVFSTRALILTASAVRPVALPVFTSQYLGFTSHFIPKRASFPSTVIRQ
jgi:hypothetical protein